MTISDLSIRRPVFAVMLMAGIILFGVIGFGRMGVSQYPQVDFPVVSVTTVLQGAAPEVMETDVSEVMEEAVSSIEGIRSLTSTSVQGSSIVQIEFELTRSIDVAIQDVRDKVGAAARLLPRDIEPPIIQKVNPQDQPIMWLTLFGTRSLQEMTDYAEEVLKPEFQTVQGVGEIIIGGGRKRYIRVWVDAGKLEAYRLAADDVISALQRQHLEVPAGRLESRAIEFNVRTEGEAPTVTELSNIIVTYQNGAPLYLHEVAYVEDGLADRRTIARYNGLPAVGFGIRKQRGANTVAVAQGVLAKMEEQKPLLPQGLSLDTAFNSAVFIEESVKEVQFTLLMAVLLTAAVSMIFLGSVRSTVIISLAIPTSLLGAFLVMYFADFTLNTMTLLALSLSVGIVVDDAILVLENIYRRQEEGESRMTAAVEGTRQVGFAAMAATIAVVAIFLPVAFMSGIIGRFFYEFGVTVSVSVLFSLLVALTLTPMLCSRFLAASTKESWFFRAVDRAYDALARRYRQILGWVVVHRWSTIAIGLAVFAFGFMLLPYIGKEFVPAQDQSIFAVSIETPVGSSVDYTDDRLRRCEQTLTSHPEVRGYLAAVGVGGSTSGGGVNKAIMFVSMWPAKQRQVSQQQLIEILRRELATIPGLKALVLDFSQVGFAASRGYPIEFYLRGPNLDKLSGYSEAIMADMKGIDGVVDVDNDYEVGMPEAQVIPNRAKAADLGVDMAAVGRTVNALVGGLDVTKFKDKGKRYDIRMRLVAGQRTRPDDIGQLLVRNDRGDLVRIRDIAEIRERPSLQVISRRDRQRAVTVYSGLRPGTSQSDVVGKIQSSATKILPEGYSLGFSGSTKTFQESFQSLIFALWLGILVAYMVLGAQFNHFMHPFTVLVALPFSFTGALFALFLTRQTLNIFSMIGLILLMGLVKKNSIILVDFTNQMRAQGLSREEALLKACPIRLRPILMTSFATIVAAIPACLALGPGAETRVPMGFAVLGGMIFSTGLTLLVVPAVYTILDDVAAFSLRFIHHEPHEKPALRMEPGPAEP